MGEREIRIFGKVADGNSVELCDYVARLNIPQIAAPMSFQIKGDSQWPRYEDGDVLLCSQSYCVTAWIGWEVVAGLKRRGKKPVLGWLIRSQNPRFFEIHHHRYPPLRSLEIQWVAVVHGLMRGLYREKPEQMEARTRAWNLLQVSGDDAGRNEA